MAKHNTDPWREALEKWTTVEVDLPEPEPRPRVLGRRHIVIASSVCALLLALSIAGGVLTYLNRQNADKWRDRSEALQELVAERTKALNRQTARLNVAARNLRKAQVAIARSEDDVAALEQRQRALANEKAQVEDQRAELVGLAQAMATCNDILVTVANGLIDGADPTLIDTSSINETCRPAFEASAALSGE